MSKEIVSSGNDFVVEWVDRAFGGLRRIVLQVAGADGSAAIGNMSVDKNGLVTLAGTVTRTGKQAASVDANTIADPGASGAITVTTSGVCLMTSAGAETRTIANPTFVGQRIMLVDAVHGGNIVVTAAASTNAANNTVLTFGAVGRNLELVGTKIGGALRWRIGSNDGVTLS